jgi:hypothetical protein
MKIDVSKMTRNLAYESDGSEELSPDEVNEEPLQLSQDEDADIVEKGNPDTPETEEETEAEDTEDDSQPEEDEIEIEDEDEADVETEVEKTVKAEDRTLPYKVGNQQKSFTLDDGDVLSDNTRKFITQLLAKEGLEVKTQQAVEANKRLEQQLVIEQTRARLAEEKYEDIKPFEPVLTMLQKNPKLLTEIETVWADPLRQSGWTGPIKHDAEKARLERENRSLAQKQWGIEASTFYHDLEREIQTQYGYTVEDTDKIAEYMKTQGMGLAIPGVPMTQQGPIIKSIVEMARKALIADGVLKNPQVDKATTEKAAVEKKLVQARQIQALKNPGVGGSASVAAGSKTGKSSWKSVPESDVNEIMRRRGMEAFNKGKRKG